MFLFKGKDKNSVKKVKIRKKDNIYIMTSI